MFRVQLLNRNVAFGATADQTLLAAAIDAGIEYPFGCSSGLCGTCKTRLVSGEVDLRDYSPLALGAAERGAGLILACRAWPRSDCLIVYDDDPDAPNHPVRLADGTVEAVEAATHDVVIITIAIDGGQAFDFSAGQFSTLDFGVVPPRDYSMACRPGDGLLRFHVRRMPGGATSEFVHARLAPGDRVKLRGPFGTAYWRERHAGPVLMVAGGTGLAPVLSVLESMLAHGVSSPVRLYFGVRAERDLYLTERLDALAATNQAFAWEAVLSAPDGATRLRGGYVGEAAAADFERLAGWKAYLAGPPVMVNATRDALLAKGLDPRDVHADPFFTAADAAREGQAP